MKVWLDQLNKNGLLIIEHTEDHSPVGANKVDPFGVRPTVMPYILSMFFGNQISISHSVDLKESSGRKAWLFVIQKISNEIQILN